jgi:hypothetical protein
MNFELASFSNSSSDIAKGLNSFSFGLIALFAGEYF